MIPTNKNISVLHPYVHKMGGAVKMMIYLSNILQEKNNITFYTLSYNETIFSQEKINFKIKAYSKTKLFKIISFFRIAFDIRKSDYIIIGNSPMHFVGVLSKILFFSNAKLIWRNHHYPWYYSNNTNLFIKLKRFIEKLIVSKINLVLSNGQYLKNIVDRIWTINSKILYPVLDEEFLNYKANTNKDNTQNIIFTYGRWTKGKNLHIVFNAYENLKNRVSNLILIIGGDGEEIPLSGILSPGQEKEEQNEFVKFKLKYKNNKNIKFLGSLAKEQIIYNLIKSKVFLFPSTIDSFGIVKLESLSIGVPVICFDNSLEEIIKNGINGFLVKSENEFIEKTYEVLSNSLLQKKLSTNSINSVGNFTRQNFKKQLNDIF